MAAGAGHRLGCSVPKAFVEVAGQPLVRYALDRALALGPDIHVVIVVPSSHRDATDALLSVDEQARVHSVSGGAERSESVACGLALLRPEDDIVLVHDAARCLAPTELFARVRDAVRAGAPAVVPGLPVVDTIKQVDDQGLVAATPDRSTLRAVQTPQGFSREVLVRAHASGADATDDAALVEAQGVPVLVVPGDHLALKVTAPEDLDLLARIIGGR
ncbi:2-C-methyl-D-erythritol 4-phosphate cytidylyltransferase [Austwickia sp. TVS 96-490-7B]|uniref:2-C-methyl-D-erythritol 4-phosphate cytidylyltransferase n=1 Tax=Austwickia sp. TVS 96-490-7B TaxID=2830843 RepID=UPI001D6C2D02|nr:2-C-methyl-D-erythritol 4-phosphate cytidylyltransferase [Austwickia sp. TVS 96-490-7B]MBW3083843.1 2-C-methyl-D-erythritol 4-phosphate cytidylyltransferase [Austwickia sp. TVS 96-490-7B]